MALPHVWADLWRVNGAPATGDLFVSSLDGPVRFPAVPAESYGDGLAIGLSDQGGWGSATDLTGTNHGNANTFISGNSWNGWPTMGVGATGSSTGLFRSIATMPTGATNLGGGHGIDATNGRLATFLWNGAATSTNNSFPWSLAVGNAAGGFVALQSQTFSADLVVKFNYADGLGRAPQRTIFRTSNNSVVLIGTAAETVSGVSRARVVFQSYDLTGNTWGTLTRVHTGVPAAHYLVEAVLDANDRIHLFYRDLTGVAFNSFPGGQGALYHVTIDTNDAVGAVGTVDSLALDATYGRFPTGLGCAWDGGVVLPYIKSQPSPNQSLGCAQIAYFPSDLTTSTPQIDSLPMLNTGTPSDLTIWQLGTWYSPTSVQPAGTPGTLVNRNGTLLFFANQARAGTKASADGVYMARYTGASFGSGSWTGYIQYYQTTWTRTSHTYVHYLPHAGQIGFVVIERDNNFQVPPGVSSGAIVWQYWGAFRYIDDEPVLGSYPSAVFGDCGVGGLIRRQRAWAAVIG